MALYKASPSVLLFSAEGLARRSWELYEKSLWFLSYAEIVLRPARSSQLGVIWKTHMVQQHLRAHWRKNDFHIINFIS